VLEVEKRMKDLCRCGHAIAAHEHFRRGTECVLCEPGSCPRYRRVGVLARYWSSVRARGPGRLRAKTEVAGDAEHP
jgi:hypothetical protein